MRPLIALQVLLLVANTWAAEVNLYMTFDDNEVTVSYTADSEANLPRAFGLDIQLDNSEKIHNVTPLDPNYWVYPGSFLDTNTPVGDPCDSDDTLPGEDSNGVTIEMASLHSPTGYDSPNAPAQSGELLSFTVTGDCSITISENEARGGVVKYDATRAITNLPLTEPHPPGCQCYGDVTTMSTGIPGPGEPFDWDLLDGQNGIVNIADLQACVNAIINEPGFQYDITYPPSHPSHCLDITTLSTGIPGPGQPFDPNLLDGPNGIISIADLQAIVNAIKDEPGFSRGCIPLSY